MIKQGFFSSLKYFPSINIPASSFSMKSATHVPSREAGGCLPPWIVTCRRSSFMHMHWLVRLIVSLVMMALAFGVPKPPCSGPAQNVTFGKLALTVHFFLKACIPAQTIKFDDVLWVPVRDGRRDDRKIGKMASCTTQWIWWGWKLRLFNCVRVPSVFFLI